MIKYFPITQAREELATLVDNAKKKLAEYVITVNGSPAAVIISAAEYESWKESIEIAGNPQLLEAIHKGEEDIEKGNFVTFEDLKKELQLHV